MGTEYDVLNIKDGVEAEPIEVLNRSISQYYPRIAIASSFSVEDTVLIDMASKIEPKIKVFYINTGFQFKETDEVKEALKKRYDLNLVEYSSLLSMEEQSLKCGTNLHERDSDLCCKLRKVEPIKRALRELDAWITGMRREQARTRRDIKIVGLEYKADGKPLVKVNPLAHWTRQQVWDYIVDNQLLYNTLYDNGYLSIGCEPCTRPVLQGEGERAGRWSGKGKTECGIHTFMRKEKNR
jgi:phosphoadenosine phosphosulfate reductase